MISFFAIVLLEHAALKLIIIVRDYVISVAYLQCDSTIQIQTNL